MQDACEIKIVNKLRTEKRGLNIYHQSTQGSHIISTGSSVRFSLKPGKEDDFLHLSVISGPGPLWKECRVGLPSWCDFDFSGGGALRVEHCGEKLQLVIPPGPPSWQLVVTRAKSSNGVKREDAIVFSDE